MRLGKENGFEGIDTSYTIAVIVDEEVSSVAGLIRNSHSRRNWDAKRGSSSCYAAVSDVGPDTMHLPTPRRRDGEQMNL
ncbi:hypothetical protein QYF36_003220 [Acer negundo]|nr:hypothetical protein QYF36_003220 [Acer negundo]